MTKKKLGNCFEANTNKLLEMWFKNKQVSKIFFLCHGKVIGAKNSPVENKEFMHCWIENKKGDLIFDYSNDKEVIVRKELLEHRIIKETIIKFTIEQIANLIHTHEHYGWFTKKELEILGD